MNNITDAHTKKFQKRLLPIILIIGIVPLLVHIYAYKTGLEVFDWFPTSSANHNDFFLAWKAIAIVSIGIVALLIMGYQKAKERNAFRFENAFYLLLFYSMFVAMSALFSNYKKWVALGTYELLEPVWVLFAYVVLCYYTYNVVRNEYQLNQILLLSGIGVIVALTIGTFQTFGFDLFQTQLGKMLITNPSNWSELGDMHFSLGNLTYITLYNPGYVVFYVGLVLPVLIALFINSKNKIAKVFLAILSIASVLCLIGARTTTGWMALLIAFIISGVVLLSRNKKVFRISLVVLLILIIAGFGFMLKSSSMQGLRDVIFGTYKAESAYGIKSITTDQDVCIDFNGVNTHFAYDSNSEKKTMDVYCTDDDGNPIQSTTLDNGATAYIDKNGAAYQVSALFVDEDLVLSITIEDHEWIFAKGADDTYYYVNAAAKAVKFTELKQVTLFNDDAMSNRGHIWNKTIPLLAKHILVGSGANTYLFEVPQEDYLYKNYSNMNNVFDVKPHSWYLQLWVENGMIALVLLIAFYLCYFVNSIRIYRKVSFNDNVHRIGFAIFVGLLIYMISAFVNDSTVNVAPIYWVALGLGYAVNRMIVEKESLFITSATQSDSVDTVENQVSQDTKTIAPAKKNGKGKQSRKARKQSGKQKK